MHEKPGAPVFGCPFAPLSGGAAFQAGFLISRVKRHGFAERSLFHNPLALGFQSVLSVFRHSKPLLQAPCNRGFSL